MNALSPDQGQLISEQDGNQVSEVVVYSNQVYVKRRARALAQRGLNQFLMEVKAFRVDGESAQASILADGEILSVQYREIPAKEAPQEDVRELVAKKDELQRRRKLLKIQQDVQDKQSRFLDSVTAFAEKEVPAKIKTRFPETENLKTMLAFLGENFQKLADKTLELKRQVEELDKEISLVEKKLKKLQRPKQAVQRVIEILFESPVDQEVAIETTYVALNASWTPVYKVDVPQDLSQVKLTMFARIQQSTGENWKKVKLAVSNAVPLKGTVLPTMQSWYLSLPSPEFMVGGIAEETILREDLPDQETRSAGLASPTPAAVAAEMAVLEAAEMPPEAEFRQAQQKELPLAFEYELPRKIDIGSGGGETLLPLFSKEMAGEFYYYAVPKNDPLAYLVCCIAADSALLAGRLNVHFGGRFAAGTTLTEKKAGEDLLVNLGAERALKVRREKVADKLTETFFGKVDRSSVARELGYRIQIENLRDEIARVHVFDSIPVSKTDRIQIKGIEIEPKPTIQDYQDREGVMQWDLQLKPKAVTDLKIKFFVKHPKGNSPLGL